MKPCSAVAKSILEAAVARDSPIAHWSQTASFVFHRSRRSSRTTGSPSSWFREYFQFQGHELNTLTPNQHKPICATRRSPELSRRTARRHGPGWKDNAHRGSLRNNFKNQLCPWIKLYKLLPGLCCSPPRSCALPEFSTAQSINKLHSGPLVVFKFMLSLAVYCCSLG